MNKSSQPSDFSGIPFQSESRVTSRGITGRDIGFYQRLW